MQRSPQPDNADLPHGRGAGLPPTDGSGSRHPDSPGLSKDAGKTAEPAGERSREGRRILLRYAGLSSQVVASVGVAVFFGIKGDKWLRTSFPILAWALPLLVIVVLIINLIKASSSKKNGK